SASVGERGAGGVVFGRFTGSLVLDWDLVQPAARSRQVLRTSERKPYTRRFMSRDYYSRDIKVMKSGSGESSRRSYFLKKIHRQNQDLRFALLKSDIRSEG
ncbi:MAG: hypothetical protein NT004_10620, partial [Bacteroidetes bacterium]|nr:hypothetical protein [Bacteroidota bacterium]